MKIHLKIFYQEYNFKWFWYKGKTVKKAIRNEEGSIMLDESILIKVFKLNAKDQVQVVQQKSIKIAIK